MEEYSLSSIFPSLPRSKRGSALVLGKTPNGEKIQYCNGNSVFTILIDSPKSADIYTEHAHQTTVAKTSPSGFYCASGDTQGNVRIWDTTQTTHILKKTVSVFSGAVKDIAWDGESKRLAVVGEGRERFGHVFLFDTGTSNGNLTGQSRAMNCVDFRPIRPFRIISGSDDNTVAIFEGPPFKFKSTFNHHSKFVHSTRFSPDGSLFASAGGDGIIVFYNGVDGSKIGEIEAHKGSIFSICWSPDGTKIASASADKSVKIWNVSERNIEKTILIGKEVEDQQVGLIWTEKALISVSASGFLNFLDAETGEIREIRYGHNKGITGVSKSSDGKNLFSCDADGNIVSWDISSGKSQQMSPNVHSTMITGMQWTENGLLTVSWDDNLRVSSDSESKSFKLPSQPLGISVFGDVAVVACSKHIAVFTNGKLNSIPIEWNSTSIAIYENWVAVGGNDSKVHIYKLEGEVLVEVKVIEHSAGITALSFSGDGNYLAVTDQSRKVIAYFVPEDFKLGSPTSWTFHTSKISCIGWSPDNSRLATGSLDNSVIVWDLKKPSEHPIIIKGAHAKSSVNSVLWLDEKTLVSAGQDANIKFWNVPV